jgi:hypothetical protein
MIKSLNVAILQNAVLFAIKFRCMSNKAKGDIEQIDAKGADADRLTISKKLFESPEYDAIREFQSNIRKWTKLRCVPSYFQKGLFIVKNENVPAFEAKLKDARPELQTLVESFVSVYESQKNAARESLAGLYNENDYPPAAEIARRFGWDWNWVAIGVPDSLPEELKAAEAAKIEGQFKAAEVEIMAALREGFAKVVEHITDRLAIDPNNPDAKPKTFRDSLFEDLTDLVETFSARNLTDDKELGEVMTKAREILAQVNGTTPAEKAQAMREAMKSKDGFKAAIREKTAAAFEAIKQQANALVIDKPTRKFNFED